MAASAANFPLRVAVIGAGAAGLVALRHLSSAGPDVFRPVAFERASTVGGTWIYTDDVGVDAATGQPIHSSMYRGLRTNLPKEVMAFPDFAFDASLQSFIRHEDVLRYLDDYAEHFKLKQFIEFSTSVERVHPVPRDQRSDEIPAAAATLTSGGHSRVQWHVTVRDVMTGHETTELYDAVIVCNGHYSVPLMPSDLDLSAFRGMIFHSHDYRDPEPFRGRSVAVLGAGPSGVDIAIEISPLVDQLYLCHREIKQIPLSALPPNVVQKAGIQSLSANGAILENGDCLSPLDALVVCTGYHYAFPFLSADCQLTVSEGERVFPLYKHLIHCRFPTMAFVGIPKNICPFPLFDRQVQFFLASLRGTLCLPSPEEMEVDAREEFQRRCVDSGRPEVLFHSMKGGRQQWKYNDELAAMAGIEPLAPSVESLYKHVSESRQSNLVGYKDRNYEICDRESFVEL